MLSLEKATAIDFNGKYLSCRIVFSVCETFDRLFPRVGYVHYNAGSSTSCINRVGIAAHRNPPGPVAQLVRAGDS